MAFQWLAQGNPNTAGGVSSATKNFDANSPNSHGLSSDAQNNCDYNPGILSLLDTQNVYFIRLNPIFKLFINILTPPGRYKLR